MCSTGRIVYATLTLFIYFLQLVACPPQKNLPIASTVQLHPLCCRLPLSVPGTLFPWVVGFAISMCPYQDEVVFPLAPVVQRCCSLS